MGKEYDVPDAPITIRYKGVFDFDAVYNFLFSWLMRHKCDTPKETLYKDKVETARGNEVEVKFEADRKVTEFYKYYYYFTFHIWEFSDVTVNGKKMMKGRIEVTIKGKVETDWQKRFKTKEKKTHKIMSKFLHDVVLKNEILLQHVDPMDHQLQRLGKKVKALLNMEAE